MCTSLGFPDRQYAIITMTILRTPSFAVCRTRTRGFLPGEQRLLLILRKRARGAASPWWPSAGPR